MAKPKLCQIIALLTGKKTASEKAMTDVYHRLQKPALFVGLNKRFIPKDEDAADFFPDETQRVQQRAKDCLEEVRTALVNMLDLTATQDKTNCVAKANVVVDEKIILPEVPVTHLLFLEKQLTNLLNVVGAVPTLDPSEDWKWSDDAGYYVTQPTEANKTKKTTKVLVKYQATEQHPAQTETYNEDVVIGQVRTVKFSAALPAQEKSNLLDRVSKLRDAVKLAREEANAVEVVDTKYGDAIFNFVLDKPSWPSGSKP